MITGKQRLSRQLMQKMNKRKESIHGHGCHKKVLVDSDDVGEVIDKFVNVENSVCVHCGMVIDITYNSGEGCWSVDRIKNGDSQYEVGNIRLVHNCCNEHESHIRRWGENKVGNYIDKMKRFGVKCISPQSVLGKNIIENNKLYFKMNQFEQRKIQKTNKKQKEKTDMNTKNETNGSIISVKVDGVLYESNVENLRSLFRINNNVGFTKSKNTTPRVYCGSIAGIVREHIKKLTSGTIVTTKTAMELCTPVVDINSKRMLNILYNLSDGKHGDTLLNRGESIGYGKFQRI